MLTNKFMRINIVRKRQSNSTVDEIGLECSVDIYREAQ